MTRQYSTIPEWLETENSSERSPVVMTQLHSLLSAVQEGISDAKEELRSEQLQPVQAGLLTIINQLNKQIIDGEENKRTHLPPLQNQARFLQKVIMVIRQLRKLSSKKPRQDDQVKELITQIEIAKGIFNEVQRTLPDVVRRNLNNLLDQLIAVEVALNPLKFRRLQRLFDDLEEQEDEIVNTYEKILAKIQSRQEPGTPYLVNNLDAIYSVFDYLDRFGEVTAIIINSKMIVEMLHIINETSARGKKIRFQGKLDTAEKYMVIARYYINCVDKNFSKLLEKNENERNKHKYFYDLVENIFISIKDNEKRLPHRNETMFELRRDILGIACDLYTDKINENTAVDMLRLSVETEKLLAQADSPKQHSRYASVLTRSVGKFFEQKAEDPINEEAALVALTKAINKALNNYDAIRKNRKAILRNRLFSQNRISACKDIFHLVKFSFVRDANTGEDRKLAFHEVRGAIEGKIDEIKKEHGTTWGGRLGLTESVLARKLEAALKCVPTPPKIPPLAPAGKQRNPNHDQIDLKKQF